MMLLIPIPVHNNITGEEEDVTVALVMIDLQNITSIDLDKETGYGIIFYRGNSRQDTKVPFTALLKFFQDQGIVYTNFAPLCTPVSSKINNYFNPKPIKPVENGRDKL